MTEPFLRIPPFPGHRAGPLAVASDGNSIAGSEAIMLIELLRKHRVGGTFWAGQPQLPDGRDLLLVPETIEQCREMLEGAEAEGRVGQCVLLNAAGTSGGMLPANIPTIEAPADPWHLASVAAELWAGADHEIALVAALAGRPLRLFGGDGFSGCNEGDDGLTRTIADALGVQHSYRCPFTGNALSPLDAVKLLASWRKLIDRNRRIAGVAGVAVWKRPTVDPLLWNGSELPHHVRHVPEAAQPSSNLVLWKSRTGVSLLDRLERSPLKLVEIEDGMIRGPGLGANCVPPLSIVMDERGIYFDPSASSDLEETLRTFEFDADLIERAARLRDRIVETGISKYGIASKLRPAGASSRRRVLVVGQVEDDRSVLSGGGGQTNLELLARARALEPDAWIIYRPHPDVEAGHRKGHVAEKIALHHADEIDRESAIAALIDDVDAVHCITSLAGFEALMRGKPVTTHGVPFYAGWGLTNDLADIPARRNRKRTLDELVAATLILYPRYLDPVTRLPCPPEILVERIARGEAAVAAPLSAVRRLQGKLRLALRGLQRNAA